MDSAATDPTREEKNIMENSSKKTIVVFHSIQNTADPPFAPQLYEVGERTHHTSR